MKRILSVAFSILMLCSLLLLINVGTTMAYEEDYVIVEYYVTSQVTVDGLWSGGEWDDCWLEHGRFNITNARFAFKMDTNQGPYLMSWIVEFPDNTTDAEDIWQICIDGAADGGAAPAVGDHKIEIVGHTTLTVYEGTGTGWGVQTTTAVTWADSLTTSPHDAVTHYVLEVQVDKLALTGEGGWGENPPPHGIYVAMYDASNASQGWVSWPPTGPDNPERYGAIGGASGDPIPESLSVGVVVLLSSVAVAVSFYLLRKRPKTESGSVGKQEK